MLLRSRHLLHSVIASVAMAFSLPACRSTDDAAPLANAPERLTLTGEVTDLGGLPLAGVVVYVGDETTSAAATDATGAFEIALEADQLIRLNSTARKGAGGFHLFFESPTDATQVGISELLPLTERGFRALASVQLGTGATVRGKVLMQSQGRLAQPAVGALVRLGRVRAETSADGSFTLSSMPNGTLVVTASAARFASASRELKLEIAGETTLETPLVLFEDAVVNGYVVMLPPPTPVPIATLAEGGHPFLRTFALQTSLRATKFRYSYEKSSLEGERWRRATDHFDVEFPQDGGNVLYYQFADEDEKELSDILQLTIVLDQFAGTKGIVIDDGKGFATRRNVLVHVDVPAAAYRMRFAEAPEELELRQWREPQRLIDYTFELRRNIADGRLLPFGQRILYCQFLDAFDLLSPVYRASVIIDLFPQVDAPLIEIAGGAPQTESRLVDLRIVLPPNAYEMRIIEPTQSQSGGFGGSSNEIWLTAATTARYVFRSAGTKTLAVQFRTIDDARSPVYEDQITVLPFQQRGIGLAVNGGALESRTQLLAIEVFPPYLAKAFRLLENQDATEWMALVPRTAFRVQGTGSMTIGIQFLDIDDEESPVFTQAITVVPLVPGTGSVVIDDGASITYDPVMKVSIFAPQNAVALQIFEDGSFSTQLTWYQITTPNPALPTVILVTASQGTGAKIMNVRFRDVDGNVGDFVQDAIFYDPWSTPGLGVTIDAGAASTTQDTVTLTFPGSAHLPRARVGLDPLALRSAPLLALTPSLTLTLPGTTGTHRVYIQFEAVNGEQSPLFFDEIERL